LYVNFQQKINECEVEIEKLLKEQINSDNEKKQHLIDKKVCKKIKQEHTKKFRHQLAMIPVFWWR